MLVSGGLLDIGGRGWIQCRGCLAVDHVQRSGAFECVEQFKLAVNDGRESSHAEPNRVRCWIAEGQPYRLMSPSVGVERGTGGVGNKLPNRSRQHLFGVERVG